MQEWIRHHWRLRGWLNLLLLFSAYMAVVYVPWDFFVKPVAQDEEVWFGVRFEGVWAKLLEIPHWVVYALGAWGLWKLRPWVFTWGTAYLAQVAFSMAVWPLLYQGGFTGVLMGAVSGGLFAWLAWSFWQARARFAPPRAPLRERYGDWALVTGASAGIGAEFARALARDGVSCVLAARREDRLAELARELEQRHGVKTRAVACDLATPDGVTRLLSAVADLDVAILVNNAGVGYAGRFDKQDRARLDAMVQLNCAAPVALTAALLPPMQARRAGAVIFVGSVAGCQPIALHALYAATKAFDNLLGEALWAENAGSGVDVLVLEPGPTVTEFQAAAGELEHPGESAAKVVAVALDALGRQPSVVSGAFNWLRANLAMRLAPRGLLAMIAKDVMRPQTPAGLQ
jgi:hypothetical protein